MKPIVFCVEDDEDIQLILQLALGTLGGFEVHLATDAEEALVKLEQITPSLLLLDWMLPGMTGLELLSQLRQQPRFEQVPAVLLTAKLTALEELEGQRHQLAGIISKPFDPLRLADQVRAYL